MSCFTAITFFEQKDAYKVVSLDSKPTDKPLAELGGTLSPGEFGSLLGAVFDPASSTECCAPRQWARISNRFVS